MLLKFIIFIISLFNTAYGGQDCPADMVLWRSPGSMYTDCVCPTGQSMVTNLFDANLKNFGKCSETYIPLSKTWASDIDSSLGLWLDADDPYGNSYRPASGSINNWISKAGQWISVGSPPNFYYNNLSLPNNSVNYNTPGGYVFPSTTTSTCFDAPTVFVVGNFSTNAFKQIQIFGKRSNFYIGKSSNNIQYTGYVGVLGSSTCNTSTITAPTSASQNTNQIFVGYARSSTIYAALINSSAGYTNNYNSTDSYVNSTTSLCSFYSCTTPYASKFGAIANSSNNIFTVKEILVYQNSLSDSQISQIISILNQKWQVY